MAKTSDDAYCQVHTYRQLDYSKLSTAASETEFQGRYHGRRKRGDGGDASPAVKHLGGDVPQIRN